MRYFNTAGPCVHGLHYMVPPEKRLPEARGLAERGFYFVVHAPRQTGKTTTLRALAKSLTESNKFAALHFSCEAGEPAGDDYASAQQAVLGEIQRSASSQLTGDLLPPSAWPAAAGPVILSKALAAWTRQCPRPIVLIFDEVDALRGEGLRSVLRQLRAGYPDRPRDFPHAVILCGLRDVREYKTASGGDAERLGSSSPFNIKVESLRLGDFTRPDVEALYRQHQEETGQAFTPEAIELAFRLTHGQPWLVNSLARELTEKMGIPPASSITAEHVEEAKERLILARATHLDSLVARLDEPRVQRIIEPVLAGTIVDNPHFQDDFDYVRDLGLICGEGPVTIANPIYREVIVRVLAGAAELRVAAEPKSFLAAHGRLDFDRLLDEFSAFWREHGEVLASEIAYHEVAPQLVLMAFLQRIVNGGGTIDREYGVGRGRIDLLVRWPHRGARGERVVQREALELKVWRAGKPMPLDQGLAQLDEYLERLGLDHGVLVIFDRRGGEASRASIPGSELRTTAKARKVRVMML
jgi:hypothetical protein